MAHAESTKRVKCMGCSAPLLKMDTGHQYCLVCRHALMKGAQAWQRRMEKVAKKNKGKNKPMDDPIKGLEKGE